jgi:hypothetical protein
MTKPSGSFGTITEPIAEVEIKGKNPQKWHRFIFKIDSGAVVTLMNKGDCQLFGLTWDSGQRVNLNAVGKNPITTYVHRVDMKVGSHVIQDVRVAFADNPVELLLGRLEVFHFFDIDLRGRVGQSVFYH